MRQQCQHAVGEAPPLRAIIIGAGFGGIGMAVAFKRAGIGNFVILERAADVGGVWRDNGYPGAACDVPSHLYSFSFAPNPDWSRVFAGRDEIYAYLRDCATRFGVLPHVRFGAEVTQAAFDEAASLWRVTLADGSRLSAALLITATGQLSRPSVPAIPGAAEFRGHAFHSAAWDHRLDLSGKRVAVIGTGASAIQFVPAIAGKVAQLTVFQRSPAYLLARPDRAYTRAERTLFRALPWTMKLVRLGVYLKYEARALAFTRLKGLMRYAVGWPFQRMLARQVPDPALRARLQPDYPIGCKRILLSSDYLPAIGRANVQLVTDGVARIAADGVVGTDGTLHRADVIVYGTGFAATAFLAPMRVTGRDGRELNAVWRDGAAAYLGMTVPGFPNFFMLYGPNTNLGHNSIVYMLESQIAHVMRCVQALHSRGADAFEVDPGRYARFNARVQQRLTRTVWNGCRSWYVDAAGHNSTNWPGFTVSYRGLTRHASLSAYSFTRAVPALAQARAFPEPPEERAQAAFQRGFLRLAFRPLIGPPFGARAQRAVARALAPLMPGVGGVARGAVRVGATRVETLHGAGGRAGTILYLHGGAFCLGSARTHRSVTSRLAAWSGMRVWVPDYRLAPEHPYPAALDDALACYDAVLAGGEPASRVVLAGDSAGGMLALALALRLRALGRPLPAGMLLLSPLTDMAQQGESLASRRAADPMVREAWVRQAAAWYACPAAASEHRPLETGLAGLPPMLIQVGDDETLLSDATRLASHAQACGVPCRLELYEGRWHVFQLQAFYLASARAALRRLALFAVDCVDGAQRAPLPRHQEAV